MNGKNVMSADNQQERLKKISLESSETICQTLKSEDIVRPT